MSTWCRCRDNNTPKTYCQHPATRLLNGTQRGVAAGSIQISAKGRLHCALSGDVATRALNQTQFGCWASRAVWPSDPGRLLANSDFSKWGRWGSCRRNWDRLKTWRSKSVWPQKRDSRYRNTQSVSAVKLRGLVRLVTEHQLHCRAAPLFFFHHHHHLCATSRMLRLQHSYIHPRRIITMSLWVQLVSICFL